MQTIEALQGGARTTLVHNFGNGLDGEDRFLVERFKVLIDGDIRPIQSEAPKAKGRNKVKHMVVSREEAQAMRPARTEIIIWTEIRTRGSRQYWGTSRPRFSTTADRGAEPPSRIDVPPACGCSPPPGRARVQGALWDEIDLKRAVWTVPDECMNVGREHRVPLSDGDDAVFPSPTGRPPSHQNMAKLARELALGAVPHGFRSSFRDWAAECTEAPREVCELALAHVNNDRVEAAYRRRDLFERRRTLMQQWADYIGDEI